MNTSIRPPIKGRMDVFIQGKPEIAELGSIKPKFGGRIPKRTRRPQSNYSDLIFQQLVYKFTHFQIQHLIFFKRRPAFQIGFDDLIVVGQEA